MAASLSRVLEACARMVGGKGGPVVQKTSWWLAAAVMGMACVVPAPAQGMEQVADFGANPGGLTMFRQLPSNTVGPVPLVLVLHGCSQTGPAYADTAGWTALSNTLGFALVVAEQPASNNQARCFNWFEDGDITRGQGESQSLRSMVEHTKANASIDGARVFVTGLSAGAAMAVVMLATSPDLFAAGAVMAGVPYRCGVGLGDALSCMGGPVNHTATAWGDLVRAASTTGAAMPRISIWQGDQDTTVHPANANELVLQWTNVHGVESASPTQVVQGRDTRSQWSSNGKVVVERHVVAGMGHGTPVDPGSGPTQCGTAAPYMLDVDICSTLEVAAFFGLTSSNMVDAGQPLDAAQGMDAAGMADAAVVLDASPALDAAAGVDVALVAPDAAVQPALDAGHAGPVDASNRGDGSDTTSPGCACSTPTRSSGAWWFLGVALLAARRTRRPAP